MSRFRRPRRRRANTFATRHDRVQDKRIKRLEQQHEQKERTFSRGDTLTPLTAVVVDIGTIMAQGDDVDDREGNQIRMKNLTWRWHTNTDGETAAEGVTSKLMRMLIIIDRRPTATLATWQQMFRGAEEVDALYNTDNEFKGRFQFLFDRTFMVPGSTVARTVSDFAFMPGLMIHGKGFLNLKNRITTYNLTTATQGALTKNQLLLCWLTEGGSTTSSVHSEWRFTYFG